MNSMKGKEKEKLVKNVNRDVEGAVANEIASRKEVGVQDNLCTPVPQGEKGTGMDSVSSILEKLVGAVDNVTGKLGGIESRLNQLEAEARGSLATSQESVGQWQTGDEPLFNTVGGTRPKQRRVKQIMSDVEIIDSDSDGKTRKKKKAEKKPTGQTTHTVSVMSPEQIAKLNQVTDRTIVEKRVKPGTTAPGTHDLGTQQNVFSVMPGVTDQGETGIQGWTVDQVVENNITKPVIEPQRDLLDFLKPTDMGQNTDTFLSWPEMTKGLTSGGRQTRGVRKEDEAWRDDTRLQTLVWERLQQLENEAKLDGTQGKRKRSGRYVVTDNSTVPPYRKWANEAVLVGPSRKRVTFDELTQTQFTMGFIKNILDTTDQQMRHNMLLEFWELVKLADATSWGVAKSAYITQMHAIEDGEITWADKGALLQKRMIQTHVGAFGAHSVKSVPTKSAALGSEKRLVCKFHRSGSCRETGDVHIDPMTGILYTHDPATRRK